MPRRFPQLMFTDGVRRAQERNGSRQSAARMEVQERDDWTLGSAEREFIASRDSFYLATVNEEGHALPLGPNARRWMALRRHALTRRPLTPHRHPRP